MWNQDLKNIRSAINKYDGPIPDLPLIEQQAIKAYWRGYGIDVPLDWHRFFYGATGVKDVRYIPEPVFHLLIKPCFNIFNYSKIWGDKAYTDLFIRDAKTVRSVVRNVHGRFLDENFQLINMQKANDQMNAYEHLVIKPTTYTHTGMGVKLLNAPYDLSKLNDEYKENYVLQIPLKQHDTMGKLNPSSINTIRVNSVLFETEAHVMSAFVKVGQAGEFADNHGSNRYFIGIQKDGVFCDYAINHDLKKFADIPSGFHFAGQPVPHFDRVCSAIEAAHKCIPHFGMAFWDVCVNEVGDPVVVEVNLRYPDTVIPQTCGIGGFLGEYTDEILKRYTTVHAR